MFPTKLRANFLTGTVILIPLVLTFWVLYFLIDKLNLLLLNPLANMLGNIVPSGDLEILTKLLILIILLILVTFIGFATRVIIIRNIFRFGERILYKLPMISTIYRTIKEISFTLWMHKDTIFERVVLVEYPRKGIYQLGFVISGREIDIQKRTNSFLLNVFVPTTPNPTTGMLIFIPEGETISLDMTVADGMKMIISGRSMHNISKTGHD